MQGLSCSLLLSSLTKITSGRVLPHLLPGALMQDVVLASDATARLVVEVAVHGLALHVVGAVDVTRKIVSLAATEIATEIMTVGIAGNVTALVVPTPIGTVT